MTFTFNSDDEMKEFQSKVSEAKRALCPGRTLDDLEFFKLLMQKQLESSQAPLRSKKIPGIDQ